MKLGKILNLSKCFYDKDHWTHPDFKEGQLYIVQKHDTWYLGYFVKDLNKWVFKSNGSVGYFLVFGVHVLLDKTGEGWKHIQEVIV